MAIKVRCDNCRKKISIDEAFAGGVCRCPYCGAMKMVPGASSSPARASRPDRPDAPGAPAPAEETPREQIPVAKPVLIQGVVAMVLLALLILMAAFSVLFLLPTLRPGGWGDGDKPENPLTEGGTQILEMQFKTPVVFVLDAGSGSRDVLDLAGALMRTTIINLKDKHQFNVILAREEDIGVEHLSKEWLAAGAGADGQVKAFLESKTAAGQSDLQTAMTQAIGLSGKSIILLTGKAPADPPALAEAAKARGVTIVVVSLGNYPDVNAAAKELAEGSGGAWKGYTVGALMDWYRDIPPLP